MFEKKYARAHLPCPCGSSSDAYAEYADGGGFCFSCSKYYKGESSNLNELKKDYPAGESKYVGYRGISESTMRFYDIKTKFINNVPVEQAYPYPCSPKGMKIRSLLEKGFYSLGNMTKPGLFGKDKFDPGSRDSITITEGELDAASVYEMLMGRTAAVSVTNAGMAARDLYEDREYVNSFDKIYLCFDNDEAGQKALRSVVGLFDFNKVYIVKLHRYKDANEYLQNQEANNFEKAWKNARRYSPDNIISTFAEIRAALEGHNESQLGTYPFKTLNEKTYGLHEGEVIVVKARRGVGKTELLRAIEYHLLKTTSHNIGLIHLEEDNGTTIKALAGYQLGLPAVLPDSGISLEDVFSGYTNLVDGDESRVHLYNSFELEDENAFIDNIRFMVAGAGCRFIVFDHITWLATGGDDQDERKKLDRISQRLKLLAKELRFCLIMVSHINQQGGTRGSMNIENVANTIIFLDRQEKHQDEEERKKTFVTLEKVRLGGSTGPSGTLIMNNNFRLEEVDNFKMAA